MSLKQVAKDNRGRLITPTPLTALWCLCFLLPFPKTGMAQVSPLRLAEAMCGFIFVLLPALGAWPLSVVHPNVCFLGGQSTREPKG